MQNNAGNENLSTATWIVFTIEFIYAFLQTWLQFKIKQLHGVKNYRIVANKKPHNKRVCHQSIIMTATNEYIKNNK